MRVRCLALSTAVGLVVAILVPSSDAFQPLSVPKVPPISTSALFGKKKKGGGGGGGGKQQQQEKQSVKDARFDAATRQFMFTLVGLTKILPDKSKKILDNIHLSFYPGAKIGIVGKYHTSSIISVWYCLFLKVISSLLPPSLVNLKRFEW